MTAMYIESVLKHDLVESMNQDGTEHDIVVVDQVILTQWGLMIQGREQWSQKLVTLLPAPIGTLVEVWSA